MFSWVTAAFASALFAGAVSILAKCGVKTTDSDIATALRTCVVAVFCWIMVAIVGSFNQITSLSSTAWLFLILSGAATGASWVCYFKALSSGDVNKVVPIDKSSTLMAVIISIVLFSETNNLVLKLAGTAIATAGTFMMIEKKNGAVNNNEKPSYLLYALLAAIFAALTSVLAKIGIQGVESNLATAIRTMVVLVMAWAIVFGKGKLSLVKQTKRNELGFLAASGVATGASWLFFYYAIQVGQVSIVVQIDKLSLLVSIAFAVIVFKEHLSKKSALGLVLIVIGTALVTACG